MGNFSLLISVYKKDNPIWLKEAFDCIFAQTIQPDEIVLVKDGPLTQDLEDIIEDNVKAHPIFKFVINENNLGLGLALRKGVMACKNEIIARMDSDDLMPNDRFEKQFNVLNSDIDVVSCWSLLFENKVDDVVAIKKRPELHSDIVKLAHKRSPVCHAACFMRRSAVIKAGNYIDRQFYEDYNLWVRMILSGATFYNIQEPLYFVRTDVNQLKRRGGFKYLKKELKYLYEFKELGFYSFSDLLRNSFIRIIARLAPPFIRGMIFKKIWNHSSKY